MRKISFLLLFVLIVSALNGCGPNSADILEQYKDYTDLPRVS